MSSEITIVIPSFNHEQYVEQTLASCANLVCSDRPHLLLVDDGSTDNTFQIAESYLTRTAHLFSSIRTEKRKNAGLCNSLNFALREVQTKYMLLNSSDDLFHENAIQILLSAMKADPAIAVAVGDNDFIDMAGKAIEQAANNQKFSSFLEYFISQKVGFDRSNLGKYQSFLTGNYLPVGWLVDVDKIRAIGAWDPSYKMEDWQILVRLTKKYKVDIVKELTASYRSHGTNTSKTQSIQMLFDEIRIYLQEYEYALANGYIAEWRKGLSKTRHVLKINRSFFNYFFLNIPNLFSHPGFKGFLEELVSLPNFEPVSGPASPEKALHQFKIRLINEITYPNGNTIEDHTSSEVTSRLTSSMELYSNTYRQAQQYDLTQEWSRGPNDMIVALKASPAFYDRFFEESSKYLGAKHFPCFVAYFLQIPSAIIPESPLPALSHVLLLVLKIKLGLRKYLKPLKDQLLLRINSK